MNSFQDSAKFDPLAVGQPGLRTRLSFNEWVHDQIEVIGFSPKFVCNGLEWRDYLLNALFLEIAR